MLIQKDGNEIFLKIEKGEDVLQTLEKVAEENNVDSGEVIWGVGMIRNLQIGYFNGREYEKEVFGPSLEVVSFHGSIAENEPRFHIHASCAGQDHGVVGGHLFGGAADPLLEVRIRKFENIRATRQDNPKTGLRELFL